MIQWHSMELSDKEFREIIKNAPLVSIDLIVKNEEGKILLGLRINKPAQNTWFVPGGRLRKDETLDSAFNRISYTELGLNFTRDQARFVGVYEHIYRDSFFDDTIGTHYIVLAYEIKTLTNPESFSNIQHQKYRWFSAKDALKEGSNVHQNVLPYFDQPM
jgi:colanic acid biosynthesis protein WcaH